MKCSKYSAFFCGVIALSICVSFVALVPLLLAIINYATLASLFSCTITSTITTPYVRCDEICDCTLAFGLFPLCNDPNITAGTHICNKAGVCCYQPKYVLQNCQTWGVGEQCVLNCKDSIKFSYTIRSGTFSFAQMYDCGTKTDCERPANETRCFMTPYMRTYHLYTDQSSYMSEASMLLALAIVAVGLMAGCAILTIGCCSCICCTRKINKKTSNCIIKVKDSIIKLIKKKKGLKDPQIPQQVPQQIPQQMQIQQSMQTFV